VLVAADSSVTGLPRSTKNCFSKEKYLNSPHEYSPSTRGGWKIHASRSFYIVLLPHLKKKGKASRRIGKQGVGRERVAIVLRAATASAIGESCELLHLSASDYRKERRRASHQSYKVFPA